MFVKKNKTNLINRNLFAVKILVTSCAELTNGFLVKCLWHCCPTVFRLL